MLGPMWWVCRFLEDHISVAFAKRVYNAYFNYVKRPVRNLYLAIRHLFRSDERILLSGAWQPSGETKQFLMEHFGHGEWEAVRGGITGRVTGFVPIDPGAGGRKIYVTREILLDPLAVRGRAHLDLERLKPERTR